MKIVFFDGYCNLCNSFVDFLIKVDKKGLLKFASLQGETATKRLDTKEHPINKDTVIYLRDNQQFEKSTAVLYILSDLGGFWRLLKIFLVLPQCLRDFFYRLVAANRYRFISKRATCRTPSKEE